jgi:signal transduction histidine kinase
MIFFIIRPLIKLNCYESLVLKKIVRIFALFLYTEEIIFMKRMLVPYILLAAVAMFSLLVSQGIWIVSAICQGKADRETKFQEIFDKAVSFSVSTKESSAPIVHLDCVSDETRINAIHLATASGNEDVGRLFENALFIDKIESGEIVISCLDSLIRERSEDLGNIICARLTLYNADNMLIDSISYSARFTRQIFSDTYTAERVMTVPEKQYILRARYQIIPQNYFLQMRIAVIVSILASIVTIGVLFFLNRGLNRRHKELREMQSSFHGAIHDLKAPLASAYTSLTSLEEAITDPIKRMAVSQSADSVSYLTEKISMMLQSSQDIKKTIRGEQEEIFLYDIVAQVTSELQALFPHKTISVENINDPDFSFFASPNLFEAVIRILMENAVHYNDNEPKIKVMGIRSEREIRIAVSDNGVGIKKRKLKNIFKPYYTSDKEKGTGIGLYYAYTIVKAHGGTLLVESEENKGTILIVKIPHKHTQTHRGKPSAQAPKNKH